MKLISKDFKHKELMDTKFGYRKGNSSPHLKWEDVPKNEKLYTRPGRGKPALAFLHKSAVDLIPEFQWAKEHIKCDADIRSLCSQGFAKAFYETNP